jgi:geranylgeranyl reductase family protein
MDAAVSDPLHPARIGAAVVDALRSLRDAASRRVIRCDALVVGGGPGGSSCARILQQHGWKVVIADRARFPRDKVCAGWLTPQVFPLLELDPEEYRRTGLTFQPISGFRTGIIGKRQLSTSYSRPVSYAIRRCEFDDFLLRRSGAHVLEGAAIATLHRANGTWIVNEAIETPVVIGAGGHFCPVARHLRSHVGAATTVVAKEAEFPIAGRGTNVAAGIPELFFCRDLEGYAWCVRKGDYVNVGIGRRNSRDFNAHVKHFAAFLERSGAFADASHLKWRGHAYLASGTGARPVIDDGLLVIGDAAGLAYPESGEGIRPAIESGRLAAQTLVAAAGRSSRADLQPYAEAIRRLYPPAARTPASLRPAAAAVGRLLLSSSAFTRHVVLDRWFLR